MKVRKAPVFLRFEVREQNVVPLDHREREE